MQSPWKKEKGLKMIEKEKPVKKNKGKLKGITRRDFLKITGLIGFSFTLEEVLSACGMSPTEISTIVTATETATQAAATEVPPTPPDQVLDKYRKMIEEK
jgi:hypothetical protein